VAAAGVLLAPVPKQVVTEPNGEPPILLDIRRRLVAGEAVTLIDSTGPPKWWEWQVGGGDVKPPAVDDPVWGVESLGPARIALLRNPGIDRYTVTAEFRQRPGTRVQILPTAEFGLLVGGEPVPAPDGSTVATHLFVHTSDHDPYPNAPLDTRVVDVRGAVDVRGPTNRVSGGKQSLGSRRYPAAPAGDRRWRVMEAEVGPDRVEFRWRDGPGAAPVVVASLGRNHLVSYAAFCRPYAPAAVREWAPRAPVGIYLLRAAVDVRNVIITPAP
jgi:hypothetical protein